MVSEYKLEPAQARYIEGDGTHAWVVPGGNGICLALPTAASITTGCGSLADASTEGLLVVERPSSGLVIYGLVPNGASVTVTNQDGSSAGVPVAGNFFAYGDPSAESVSVAKADGSQVSTMTVAKGRE
jgi:hypothetical protein